LNSLILNFHSPAKNVSGGAVRPAMRGGAALAQGKKTGKIMGTMIPFETQGAPAGTPAHPNSGARDRSAPRTLKGSRT
jgi:hypothetical protein